MSSWQQNFHAVWPSLFATSMGLMAFLPTLALYISERFAVDDPAELALQAGLIYGVAPVAAAFAGPLWGAMGDRLGKKPMAIRANLAIAITTALMPLAPGPWWLFLLRALQGVLAGYIAPAMALVSQQAPRELHGIVLARLQVAMAVGAFLGPLCGAAISWFCGRAALFWLTSLLTGYAALRLRRHAIEVPPATRPQQQPFARELAHGLLEVLGRGPLLPLLLLVLLLRLGQNMLEPFVALFVRELGPPQFLLGPTGDDSLALELTIGAAFAVLAVAQWVFTPWWGRLADRHGPLRCLGVLGLLLGGVLLLTASARQIDAFLWWRSIGACLMAGSMTLAYAAISKRVADARRTLAFALVQSCMQLGFGLGPQLGGLVATSAIDSNVDFRRTLVVAAVCCAVAGAGMLLLRWRYQQLERIAEG